MAIVKWSIDDEKEDVNTQHNDGIKGANANDDRHGEINPAKLEDYNNVLHKLCKRISYTKSKASYSASYYEENNILIIESGIRLDGIPLVQIKDIKRK